MKNMIKVTVLLTLLFFGGCNSTSSEGIGEEDKPTITLENNPKTGEKDISINLGEYTVPEYGYSATDYADGDLSVSVERTHNIDFSKQERIPLPTLLRTVTPILIPRPES